MRGVIYNGPHYVSTRRLHTLSTPQAAQIEINYNVFFVTNLLFSLISFRIEFRENLAEFCFIKIVAQFNLSFDQLWWHCFSK